MKSWLFGIFAGLIHCLAYQGFSQNLIPNGGFETYISCPTLWSQPYLAPPWSMPTLGTSDFYHTCTPANPWFTVPASALGYQFPRTGDGMAGAVMYVQVSPEYREYLQTSLLTPLQAGIAYEVELYVNISNFSAFTVPHLGAFISTVAPQNQTAEDLYSFFPQLANSSSNLVMDSLGWVRIADTFVASGGEQYITIGNFVDDVNTTLIPTNFPTATPTNNCYFYFDDICLRPLGQGGCGTILNKEHFPLSIYPDHYGNAQLFWSDDSELPVAEYRIERGHSPVEFHLLATLVPDSLRSTNGFQWKDGWSTPDEPWYRIVRVDVLGGIAYSEQVEFAMLPEKNLLNGVAWNGTELLIDLAFVEGRELTAILSDLHGRKIASTAIPAGKVKFEWPQEALVAGIYLLSIKASDGRRDHRKIWID